MSLQVLQHNSNNSYQKKRDVDRSSSEREASESQLQEIMQARNYNKHVRFNVGGKKFDTTVGTVTRRGKDRANLLALLISGNRCCFCSRKRGVQRLRTNYSGTDTFIDRDGTHFRHILNWLRDGDGVLPLVDAASCRALLREAEYYRLRDMVKALWETLNPTMEYVETK